MAKPTDRASFKDYCLRKLGVPVISISVDDSQIEDRIDDALQMWSEFHYDGNMKFYYKYALTSDDITNRYITLPENVIGVVRLFPIGQTLASSSIFSAQYQYILNNIFDINSFELAPYYANMQYLQFIEQILVGQIPIRYNRHENLLYIDMDYSKVFPGYYILVECYQVIDPDTYPDVWNDIWLKSYATALIKRQWGEHLIKFKDIALPGGQKFNGEQIYAEGVREVQELEEKVLGSWGTRLPFYWG